MLDMRYHIVSLAAVFLALALGILLGPLIVEKGVLVKQQEKLVDEIRKDVGELKEKNQQLQKEVSWARQFEQQAVPTIVKDQLKGKRIMVLTISPISESFHEKAVKVLNQAGAEVSFLNLLSPQWGLEKENAKKKIEKLSVLEGSREKELEGKITERFAEEVTTVTKQELLKTLLDLDIIKEDEGKGIDQLHLPADGVVILRSSNEKSFFALNQTRLFIKKLKQFEVTVVGAETSKVDPSYINSYQEEGITTVDNVDVIFGQVSLVFALKGEVGSFGIKPTAERLTPLK